MSKRLRRFLYLDEDLTSNFLAQLEGGIYEEESQTTTAGRNRKGGAGAGVGPVIHGARRKRRWVDLALHHNAGVS